jgi:hypothetical protein
LRETAEIGADAWTSEMDRARAELFAEGVAQVRARAMRYVQEPADGAWDDLVQALVRTYGDSETYDLLRAVEIHCRTRNGR